MLLHTVETVSQGMKAGKSLAQIKEAGLDKRWLSYGNGFIPLPEHIETAYRSLEQANRLKPVQQSEHKQEHKHGGLHHH